MLVATCSLLFSMCWGDNGLDRRLPRVQFQPACRLCSISPWCCLSCALTPTISPLVGSPFECEELARLPVWLLDAFNPVLEPVVLDDVGRGGVLGIDPSDESESTSVACGPVGLELLGGDRGLPMFCRLLSMFSTPPERQWTFFGDEASLTGRQGGSTIEAIATGQDADLQWSSLGLSKSAGLGRCLGCSANDGVPWMCNTSCSDPVYTERSTKAIEIGDCDVQFRSNKEELLG